MIKQICIEGLWLNIPRAVDVERTGSKQGFGSIAFPANFRTSGSNVVYPCPLLELFGSQRLLRKITKVEFLLIKALWKQE